MTESEQVKILQNLMLTALYEKKGIDALHPEVRSRCEALIERMEFLGMPIIIHSTFRTAKHQDDLYEQGRTTPGAIVTNAKGLQSYHNYGLAFDAIFKLHHWNPPNADAWWSTLGLEGQKLGLEWGGRWPSPDRPHFEWHPHITWRDLEKRITVIKQIDRATSLIARIRAKFGF